MSRNIKITGYYEAKLRVPGDRVNSKGDKVEGGKTFSRHFEAMNMDAATTHAHKLERKFGTRLVSVAKVQPDDISGRIEVICADCITKVVPPIKKRDVILENITLDEMIFGSRINNPRKPGK